MHLKQAWFMRSPSLFMFTFYETIFDWLDRGAILTSDFLWAFCSDWSMSKMMPR